MTEPQELKRRVEALLFSSDKPLDTGRIARIVQADDGRQVRSIIQELAEEYDAAGRAFCVEEIAGGFQVLTRPQFGPYVQKLHEDRRQDSLSNAALETLAIVGYRQPITRAEVEDIRGVQCGHILRSLVEKRLIRVTGRADELGRPMLYGTTRQFLEAFGLKSLDELPRRSKLTQPDDAAEGAESE
jgi:segregation and condensation protein B